MKASYAASSGAPLCLLSAGTTACQLSPCVTLPRVSRSFCPVLTVGGISWSPLFKLVRLWRVCFFPEVLKAFFGTPTTAGGWGIVRKLFPELGVKVSTGRQSAFGDLEMVRSQPPHRPCWRPED